MISCVDSRVACARGVGAGARDGARVWMHTARVGLGARERVVGGARAGREAAVVARAMLRV